MRELHRAGLNCPKDVSLVATCDSSMCEYAFPELTAIVHPTYEMGVSATNILVDSIEQDAELVPEKSVKDFLGHVEYRRSCGPVGGE